MNSNMQQRYLKSLRADGSKAYIDKHGRFVREKDGVKQIIEIHMFNMGEEGVMEVTTPKEK